MSVHECVNTQHTAQAVVCILHRAGRAVSPWSDHVDIYNPKKKTNECPGGRMIDGSLPQARINHTVDTFWCLLTFLPQGRDEPVLLKLQRLPLSLLSDRPVETAVLI